MSNSEWRSWLSSTTQVKVVPPPPGSSGASRTYVQVKGSDAQGFIDPSFIDHGFLANGQEVLILPLESGGSGGVFYTLLFTTIDGRRRFVGYVPSESGHLDVHLQAGSLHVVTPIYGKNDPNCCPSQHRFETYTLNGIKLERLDQFVGR